MKKLLFGLAILTLPVGVYAVCAENEVWQPNIETVTQCTEYSQVHTGHKLGIKSEFVCWITGNDWFKGKCYHGGHVINQCIAYEQVEVDNGQCVADNNTGGGDDETGDTDEEGGGDTDSGGETENGDGENNNGEGTTDNQTNGANSGTRSGNTAESQYKNLTGQDPVGMTLQEIMKANWEIVQEKARLWNLR